MIVIDELIRTKRKSIALIVERDGRLIVRAPMRTKEAVIRDLIEKKAGWIQAKQHYAKTTYPPYVPKEYVNGEGFWYLGKIYRLEMRMSTSDGEKFDSPLVLNGSFNLSKATLPQAESVFTQWYQQQAYQVLSERVAWYAAKHGLTYQRVKITSARTRWGSCASNGTLSFTWRLVMAPVPVIDYVVVHELAHLQVKGHSKEFWGKVKLMMPDYEQRIEWLEVNGHLLKLE